MASFLWHSRLAAVAGGGYELTLSHCEADLGKINKQISFKLDPRYAKLPHNESKIRTLMLKISPPGSTKLVKLDPDHFADLIKFLDEQDAQDLHQSDEDLEPIKLSIIERMLPTFWHQHIDFELVPDFTDFKESALTHPTISQGVGHEAPFWVNFEPTPSTELPVKEDDEDPQDYGGGYNDRWQIDVPYDEHLAKCMVGDYNAPLGRPNTWCNLTETVVCVDDCTAAERANANKACNESVEWLTAMILRVFEEQSELTPGLNYFYGLGGSGPGVDVATGRDEFEERVTPCIIDALRQRAREVVAAREKVAPADVMDLFEYHQANEQGFEAASAIRSHHMNKGFDMIVVPADVSLALPTAWKDRAQYDRVYKQLRDMFGDLNILNMKAVNKQLKGRTVNTYVLRMFGKPTASAAKKLAQLNAQASRNIPFSLEVWNGPRRFFMNYMGTNGASNFEFMVKMKSKKNISDLIKLLSDGGIYPVLVSTGYVTWDIQESIVRLGDSPFLRLLPLDSPLYDDLYKLLDQEKELCSFEVTNGNETLTWDGTSLQSILSSVGDMRAGERNVLIMGVNVDGALLGGFMVDLGKWLASSLTERPGVAKMDKRFTLDNTKTWQTLIKCWRVNGSEYVELHDLIAKLTNGNVFDLYQSRSTRSRPKYIVVDMNFQALMGLPEEGVPWCRKCKMIGHYEDKCLAKAGVCNTCMKVKCNGANCAFPKRGTPADKAKKILAENRRIVKDAILYVTSGGKLTFNYKTTLRANIGGKVQVIAETHASSDFNVGLVSQREAERAHREEIASAVAAQNQATAKIEAQVISAAGNVRQAQADLQQQVVTGNLTAAQAQFRLQVRATSLRAAMGGRSASDAFDDILATGAFGGPAAGQLAIGMSAIGTTGLTPTVGRMILRGGGAGGGGRRTLQRALIQDIDNEEQRKAKRLKSSPGSGTGGDEPK